MTLLQNSLIQPNWPVPSYVRSLFTTRLGGISQKPYDSLNLGDHVGDAPEAVQENRQRLALCVRTASVHEKKAQLTFLKQVHGSDVAKLGQDCATYNPADAVVTSNSGQVCTIMVADCLPILWAHTTAKVVAAAHAGWPGLAGKNGMGVVESTWSSFASEVRHSLENPLLSDAQIAQNTLIWLGPCIGPSAFEVGADVYEAFMQGDSMHGIESARVPISEKDCFVPIQERPHKWMANLPALARVRLCRLGIEHIYGNDGTRAWCTFSNPERYFSHRRDAAVLGSTGRMAVCIWLDGV